MKIIRILIVIAIAFALFGVSAKSLAGAFSYTSGFQVQNLENTQANVTIKYYNPNGSEAASATDTIAAGGSKTYFPIHAGEGFSGSVVILSSTKVAAVSNILGNLGMAAASYVGSAEGSTTLLIPLLMKGNSGYNTWFNIQNTGSAAANVTVNYSDGTTNNATIQPGAAATFDQAVESHSATVFSAQVTSDQPVAAAVIEESQTVMFAYSGYAAGSTNPVMPLVNANNSGYVTGIQIQNAGNATTSVTVSYTPSAAGTACTETRSIQAGQSATFALYAFNSGQNSTCIPLARFIGSAQVTGNTTNQPLVAIANQLLPGRNGEAYGGFDPALANETTLMPLIMDRNSGYYTGFNVMNVGAATTNVTCTFTGTAYTVSGSLAPGEALTDIQNGQIANGYVGSGTCTGETGSQIVAVVNELGPSASADQLLVYEGIISP